MSPCARMAGDPFRVLPATRSQGFHLVPRLWVPRPPSLRRERSEFAEQEAGGLGLPEGSSLQGGCLRGFAGLWGFVEPCGPPRTRRGAGLPVPLSCVRPRSVSQRDFSPDTEQPVRDRASRRALPCVPGWDPHWVRVACPPRSEDAAHCLQICAGSAPFRP